MGIGGFLTEYGFTWGPIEVTRLASVPKWGVCLAVETEKHKLNIYVSPKGRSVRVYLDGRELK